MKLKDHIIRVKTTNRYIYESLFVIGLALCVPALISVVIFLADKIDEIDNFFQALFVILFFVAIFLYKLWKLK